MLKHLTISNFRCLRKVDVPLKPLTVLIGENDTGKTSFLHAVKLLARPSKFSQTDVWRREQTAIVIRGQTSGGMISLIRQPDGKVERAPKLGDSTDPLTPTVLYELTRGHVPMLALGHSDSGTPPELDAAAERLPTLIDYLLRRDRRYFDAFLKSFRARVPGLEDVQVATPNPQARQIELVTEDGLVLPADLASDGVKVLMFFLALSYHPKPPRVVLLEEPENGLHPRRLADVMSLLHDLAIGKNCGHPVQVILSTHSPYLLDHVEVEQDQLLVFSRNGDGSRTAEPVNKQRLDHFMDEFMLGEVWFNEGEEGLTGRKG